MSESTPMVDLVEEYLDYRRRLGFQLRIEGQMLLEFARYADRSGHSGPLTTELAVRWARLPAEAAPLYQARRLEVVRCFARHRAIFDPATEIPPEGLLGSAHRRTTPHIYSEAELSALLAAARRLPSPTGLRPRTYATLIGLLSCTGLRISEALKLSRGDVDWGQGDADDPRVQVPQVAAGPAASLRRPSPVRVRAAPGPLPSDPANRCVLRLRPGHDARRTRRSGTPSGSSASTCPCPPRPGARAPRIHDLRHTFACRRLLRWYADGADLDHAVAALSTYLGHAKVSDTYWYLTGIPELLDLAAGRFERFTSPDPGDPS